MVTKHRLFDMIERLLTMTFNQTTHKVLQLQSNLDYSKCQGPQESFRIIGSSNDRKREFLDFSEKLGCFHRTEFATSTRVFREVIGTSVIALKKMSSLEVVASSSLILCRSKKIEKKRTSDLY